MPTVPTDLELRRAVDDPARWPEVLAALGRQGRLSEGAVLVADQFARARPKARAGEAAKDLDAAFFGALWRAGFGLGDPRFQLPSGVLAAESAADGDRHAVLTARHGITVYGPATHPQLARSHWAQPLTEPAWIRVGGTGGRITACAMGSGGLVLIAETGPDSGAFRSISIPVEGPADDLDVSWDAAGRRWTVVDAGTRFREVTVDWEREPAATTVRTIPQPTAGIRRVRTTTSPSGRWRLTERVGPLRFGAEDAPIDVRLEDLHSGLAKPLLTTEAPWFRWVWSPDERWVAAHWTLAREGHGIDHLVIFETRTGRRAVTESGDVPWSYGPPATHPLRWLGPDRFTAWGKTFRPDGAAPAPKARGAAPAEPAALIRVRPAGGTRSTVYWCAPRAFPEEILDAPLIHPAPILRLELVGRGGRLLSVGRDGAAAVWDLVRGLPIERLAPSGEDRIALVDGQDDRLLALEQRGLCAAEGIRPRKEVLPMIPGLPDPREPPWADAACLPSQPTVVAATQRGRIYVFAVDTMRPGKVRSFDLPDRKGGTGRAPGPPELIACRPVAAGKLLAALSRQGERWRLRLVGFASRRLVAAWDLPGESAEASMAEVGRDGTVAVALAEGLWLARRDARELVPLLAPPLAARPFAFTQGGRTLASRATDGAVELRTAAAEGPWQLTGRFWPEHETLGAMAWSADGRTLFYAQGCHVRIHQVAP